MGEYDQNIVYKFFKQLIIYILNSGFIISQFQKIIMIILNQELSSLNINKQIRETQNNNYYL